MLKDTVAVSVSLTLPEGLPEREGLLTGEVDAVSVTELTTKTLGLR